MCLSLTACDSKKDESTVKDIKINGQTVSITDF